MGVSNVKNQLITIWIAGLVSVGWMHCSAPSLRLQRGDELMKAEMYEQALEEYQQAASLDPQDTTLMIRVKQIRKLLVERSVDACNSLLELKEYDTALVSFSAVLQYGAGEPTAALTIEKLAYRFMQGGKDFLREGKIKDSFFLMDQLLEYLSAYEYVEKISKKIQLDWADELYRLASSWQEKKQPGNSLVVLAMIRKLVGNYKDTGSLEAEARSSLRAKAHTSVDLQLVWSRNKWIFSTESLADRIKQSAVRLCPALRFEKKTKQDLFVKLNLRKLDYRTERQDSDFEQKYRSGTRKIDNPEVFKLEAQIEEGKTGIDELQARLDLDAQNIRAYRQAFADAGPEEDEEKLRNRLLQAEKQQRENQGRLSDIHKQVNSLRRKLAETPKKLHEPIYAMHSYKVTKVTRIAQTEARLTAWDKMKNMLIAEQLSASASTSDTTCVAQPKYGIKADPLHFEKSDDVLQNEALTQLESNAVKHLEKLCSHLGGNLIEKIQALPPQEIDEVIELIVLYMFVTGDAPTSKMQEILERERYFRDHAFIMEQVGIINPLTTLQLSWD